MKINTLSLKRMLISGFYSWFIMFLLKFLDFHLIVWIAFVPLFYHMSENSNSKLEVALDLYVFSLIFTITFLSSNLL